VKSVLTRLLFLFSAIVLVPCAARSQDRALADQFMTSGEYDKAAAIYEKLYDTDPFGAYPGYYRCLVTMQDYDKAEKVVKKQMRRQDGNLSLLVDLGRIYELQGQADKAQQQYDKAIKSLPPDQGQVILLANAFSSRQLWDQALAVYLQGKRLLRGQYPFNFETADIYFQKGAFTEMTEEYLDAVELNPGYQQSVQNILQARLAGDADGGRNDVVRMALLRRIQRNPDQTAFSEMLIWLLVQQKDFEAAFLQARAIDRRKREDGARLIGLASLSVANSDYDAAIHCYQYVIEKGKDLPYYLTARMELLNTMNKKITETGTYTPADLLSLEKDYESTLAELGRSAATAPLIRGLAHLQVFYLDKLDEAVRQLEEAIGYPGISPATLADCKLELGDIYLFSGNVWDSGLLYSQVDKAFKNDPLGQEAKFRNARLDYFRGDFLWAQAQLDVLKSATSQLIANDALALSLLISDNIDDDSVNAPLTLFASADLLMFRRKDEDALHRFDSLLTAYPGHALTDDTWMREAQIMDRRRAYAVEDSLLASVVRIYGDGILADDALFTRAKLQEQKLNDPAKAMELYQDLLVKYPGSLFVVEARKRYRTLRGDVLN
jgi:tetratricopeptide (TPR) repeat protein